MDVHRNLGGLTVGARGRSVGAVAADVGLTVAAVLGVACVLLALAAVLFDVRIMLFSTGSMSPAIPAGSAAVARAIPAAEVAVGDVVTVQRDGKLPITHRVVAVEPVPGESTERRRITMRGDANAADDPAPYDVRTVRVVLFSVPGVAPVMASLSSPWLLGGLTIAASLLVAVVFWPKRSNEDPTAETPSGGSGPPGGANRRARRMAKLGGGAATCIALAVVPLLVAPAPAAHAAGSDETVTQGRVIRLVSIEQPAMRDLAPGTTATWQVGVAADAASPGTISITLAGTGERAADLRFEVQGCPRRWSADAGCGAPEVLIADAPVPLDGVERPLRTLRSDERVWLRFRVSAPAGTDVAARRLDLTVRATGLGDDVSTGGTGGLATTGGTWPAALTGAGVLLVAIGAAAARRRRTS